jgi:Tfp pilus assembly protein PilZ
MPESVWAFWSSGARCDTSVVRNLSAGGVFLQTRMLVELGAKAAIHFLVQEGHIQVEARVRHITPGLGLGLQFTAVEDADRPRMNSLLERTSNRSIH